MQKSIISFIKNRNADRIIAFYLLLLSSQTQFFAQTLMSSLTLNSANLNATEQSKFNNLSQDQFTKTISFIKLGDLFANTNAQGTVSFNFPPINQTITAEPIAIIQTDTSYSWTGKLISHNGFFGFYQIKDKKAAWVQINNRFFEIMPIKDGGVSSVRELKQSIPDIADCLAPANNSPANFANQFCDKAYNT